MNGIYISPLVARLGLLGVIALGGLAISAQLPEIRRYLKIESM